MCQRLKNVTMRRDILNALVFSKIYLLSIHAVFEESEEEKKVHLCRNECKR